MATLLLSTAGSALGSALLPSGISFLGATVSGAALGSAIGAGLGAYVDQQLFGSTVANSEGPRLSDLQVMSSTEGAPVPRLYGRARIAGQVIWATHYKEHSSTQSSGGKGGGGGASVTSYSYTVSFAVALCEGPVTRIGRVWADGKAMSLEDATWRLHKGDETQMPDPTIEAVEGAGNAPAYRGIAYVVFDNLPLGDYGNRVPQLSFEVFRSLSDVEGKIEAVTIIPGAGEFVYDTRATREILSESSSRAINRHSSEGGTDWSVALDQLQAVCPNVASASLVVSWFGDDLRCGACTVRPKVEIGWKITTPEQWRVAGLARTLAQVVSQVDGKPAFGGTPSDASVTRALQDMKARGLRTVFYPFVMMDVPAGNTLADPWTGAASQPAYPWRGRITSSPAPGEAGSPDKTSAAAAQVASFFGTAAVGDFSIAGGAVAYAGPAEWSYRRMILHYAHLCKAAGGVDAFLIGSELRGLTQIRSGAATYPAVAALKALAADVAGVLGPATKISYAADWSEYAGHHPADGSGDHYFHLDPLWADANIHFVGIDLYAPLSDWRKTSDHLDRALAASIYDIDYLKSRIAGGEDYDWYYASEVDRAAQLRSTIADGYGKPWVFRAKDILSWWANAHHDRPGGIESVSATSWVPQGKPVWFTELGCPAIDKGTNEPNLFTDPKSSESAAPHFSNGTRDDYIQRCFIAAQTEYWGQAGAHNPVSAVYGGRMLDAGDMFFWTWDARPFPTFPDRSDIWADGENWQRGHWLNGRLGAVPLTDLVRVIMEDVGFSDFDASELTGVVEGFVIDRIMSPRQALAPLMLARFFDAAETEGTIRFRHFGAASALTLTPDMLAVEEDSAEAGYILTRGQETELPLSAKLTFIDAGMEYRQATVEARRLGVATQRVASAALSMAMTAEDAQGVADIWLQQSWSEREKAVLKLPPSLVALDPGDVVELALPSRHARYRLTGVTDGAHREAKAVQSEASLYGRLASPRRARASATAASFGVPLGVFLDLPLLTGAETPYAPRVAFAADPWPGGIALWKGTGSGFALDRVTTREATIGRTASDLGAGVTSRWDEAQVLTVTLVSGALSSASAEAVLAGANAAALETPEGGWEVIQFREAELVASATYELRGLLRGQAGTEAAMRAPLAAGARFVLIDGAVAEMGLSENERGLARSWAYGPASLPIDDESYARETRAFAGVGLRPLSPVHPRAARGAGGDIELSWVRRTRIGGDSWEGTDVPLGEEEERYALDILSGGVAVRTFDVTAPAASYTAAMQTADFGSASFATLDIRVAQVSRAFGRGTAREATLHV
ncbi:baseplate multidomain protein megatron [Parvibaculum sp.]|uniref:baseplate multidomain protein megatron n=1 Tax=Parvibaculum sp. TaxID=2024848 RepID=UPI002B710982|nr:glycoside hydrolase/phage tail family protein [Parvibaculum sp.]HUD53507.1 glycoside hydrolase/phage tail family protein [Parvibaculum sp.]